MMRLEQLATLMGAHADDILTAYEAERLPVLAELP
jgi:hypothetical protein